MLVAAIVRVEEEITWLGVVRVPATQPAANSSLLSGKVTEGRNAKASLTGWVDK